MSEQPKRDTIRAARVYLRVSTDEQDLTRQEAIVGSARALDFMLRQFTGKKLQGRAPIGLSCYGW